MTGDLVDTAAKSAMIGGAATASVGGLALSEFLAIVGVVVAVLGLLINFWHKRSIVKIERERWAVEKAERLRAMK